MTDNENTKRKRHFNGSSNCEQVLKGLDLHGQVIAITGTTNGIGTETARSLALAGAHVILLNRNKELSEQQMESIRKEKPDASLQFIKCDLSSLASVREAAEEITSKQSQIDALILNAGVFLPGQKATSDGLESTFGVNHVGHFHLTTLLLPVLISSHSRLVIVSSDGHAHSNLKASASLEEKVTTLMPEKPIENIGTTGAFNQYCLSKLCNVLFGLKVHRMFNQQGIDVYILHPGAFIGTNLNREMGFWGKLMNTLASPFNKTLSQGAATSVYCAVHPETKGISGKYWDSCWDDEKQLKKVFADDVQLQDELWTRTEQLIEKIERGH